MKNKQELIAYCLTYENVYEDYPFHDSRTATIRHKKNRKIFALIFKKDEYPWVNIKGKPDWNYFWRGIYDSVIPAFHMNKEHWNSIILDGTVPKNDIEQLISESYKLTKG